MMAKKDFNEHVTDEQLKIGHTLRKTNEEAIDHACLSQNMARHSLSLPKWGLFTNLKERMTIVLIKQEVEPMAKLFPQFQRHVLFACIVTSLSVFGGCDNSSQEPHPDLVFTGLYDFKYVRTIPPFGNTLHTIVVEVENDGTVSAKRFQVVVHSKGPGIEGAPPPLDNDGYYSVDAGETINVRFQFIFEKEYGGEYEFTVSLDPSNAVQEEDEFNNLLVFKRRF
jgi:hypothetical protein